jgi:hypothetical protein
LVLARKDFGNISVAKVAKAGVLSKQPALAVEYINGISNISEEYHAEAAQDDDVVVLFNSDSICLRFPQNGTATTATNDATKLLLRKGRSG